MSICKCIAEIHGGKIWAEIPGLDRGITFYFTIPFLTNENNTFIDEEVYKETDQLSF